ncbi:MAG TPA: adenylosuccinate synthase [Methylomirabilota bacterium]|nr:adenylosuccinate synthase [Methylomirabilota bacterium]
MPNIVVVGAQWGDEGKGKIVDLLAAHVDVVARYQGGNNAGHTVVIGKEKFILHAIPSGILHAGKRCVIGCGVVVDPAFLLEEMEALRQRGVSLGGNLFISQNAHCIMPYHRALDLASEASRGEKKIGTTGKGVGPAYTDKAARIGIRISDLLDPPLFREKLEANLKEKNTILKTLYGAETFTVESILSPYLKYAEALAPFVADTALLLHQWTEGGISVLFEGAQGTMLDVDHGTYPYITSSSAASGGAVTGTGLAISKINGVLGVSKAYATRVGSGPFPSEAKDGLGDLLRQRGNEYGATTGRPRRCGWFDAVVLRYAVRINGIDTIALTKLDVLDECRTVQVCVGYRYKGGVVKEFPLGERVLAECVPVYEEMEGWRCSTAGLRSYEELPSNARRYLARLAELIGVGFSLISTGAMRDETILRPESPLVRWFPALKQI